MKPLPELVPNAHHRNSNHSGPHSSRLFLGQPFRMWFDFLTVRSRTLIFLDVLQGKHFSLIQPRDLILVDHHGNVQPEESGPNRLLNKAAFMIHSAIHAARPDAHCAAHSHSVYGRAFSTLGKEIDMITQDSCAFYQVCGGVRTMRVAIFILTFVRRIMASTGSMAAS